MKLIVAIVNKDDTEKLLESLIEKGFKATLISSTGGFLREGNSTFLIGADEEDVGKIVGIIQECCRPRKEIVKIWPPTPEITSFFTPPLEVEVGGATIFILNMERLIKV
ncbi:MAG: cyclic-di-AMP receptor [Anaerolineae bacterium]|nr:cyclic-di-AMP receptor [Anaerolineae bacterium]